MTSEYLAILQWFSSVNRDASNHRGDWSANRYITPLECNRVDGLAAFRFLAGLAFLGFASYRDLRTRRVPDEVWIVMGVLALVLLEVEFVQNGAAWELQLLLVPIAIIFFGVFFGEEMWTEEGFKLRSARLLAYVAAGLLLASLAYHFWNKGGSDSDAFWGHLSIPIMLVLAHLFYQFGLLRGGADAKALMSIAILVPMYPSIEPGLPLISLSPTIQHAVDLMFPFALVALLDAALLLVSLPLFFLAFNALRGDVKGIRALFGYRVGIDSVPKFVWLMELVENGKLVRVLLPRKKENRNEQIAKLREKGLDRVWVTPQIPFLVPMTFGFAAAFLVGNFILGLTLLFGR
jgi:preflagellin peptidase FlaK